jgi:hypothetical protein
MIDRVEHHSYLEKYKNAGIFKVGYNHLKTFYFWPLLIF